MVKLLVNTVLSEKANGIISETTRDLICASHESDKNKINQLIWDYEGTYKWNIDQN